MDHSSLQTPGISNITGMPEDFDGEEKSGNGKKEKEVVLDHISIKNNIFILLRDKETKSRFASDPMSSNGTDHTVIPIEVEFSFDAKIRKGMMMKYGWTQDVKFAFDGVRL